MLLVVLVSWAAIANHRQPPSISHRVEPTKSKIRVPARQGRFPSEACSLGFRRLPLLSALPTSCAHRGFLTCWWEPLKRVKAGAAKLPEAIILCHFYILLV